MVNIIEESIGRAATKIAEDIDANCIISISQKKKEQYDDDYSYMKVEVSVFKRIRKGVYDKKEYETETRKIVGSTIPIKEILMEAITRRYIDKGDKVVCVQDESMGTGYRGILFVFDVDKVFFDISTHNLAENIDSEVIESIINIAQEISKEGREGKPIGTAFIVGNKSDLLKYVRQLILNPFAGHTEDSRKITDPELKETIKEFAQLDGVFVVDRNGVIVTTGAYVDIDTKDIELPKGLGTRHMCCAAITKATDSIAVTVSQSGGVVRVFKNGKIIIRIP